MTLTLQRLVALLNDVFVCFAVTLCLPISQDYHSDGEGEGALDNEDNN
jgi:hypothetical protein